MADSALSQTPSVGVTGLGRHRALALKALAVLAVVGLVAAIAYYALGATSPRTVADRYLSAIQAGDAGTAWNVVQVDAVGSADARLIDQAAMVAALKTSRPKLSSLQFVSANPFANGQDVEYMYRNASGLQHLGLFVTKESSHSHLFVDPGWTVHLSPVVATVIVPAAGGGIAVDGIRLQVPADKPATVAVLPIAHVFTIINSPMVDGIAVKDKTNVALHATATPAAVKQVQAAVADTVRACGSLESRLTTCYGLFVGQRKSANDSWDSVSVPAMSQLSFSNGAWTGTARVIVLATYRMPGDTTDRHEALAGPVTLKATLTPSTASVTSVTSGGDVTPAERPAGATDSAAVALVRPALAKCAAATTLNPPDCPNSHNAYLRVDNVVWHMQGDPLQGAAVSWDANTSVLHVRGSYSMTTSFDFVGFTTVHSQAAADSSQYDAQLIWDGSALRLVTISSV